MFSKGHWRQTLRKPKTQKPRSKDKKYHPSLIEDLIRFGYYDEEYAATEQQPYEEKFDQANKTIVEYHQTEGYFENKTL